MQAIRDFGVNSKDIPTFNLTEETVPLIMKDFTGAFFLDDFLANSFIYAAERINPDILNDFSIVGFGNVALTHPHFKKISSLDIMTRQSGATACEVLYQIISGLNVEPVTKTSVNWVQGETLKDIREKDTSELSDIIFHPESQFDLTRGLL
jgi:DNA-binding LacI/PurR family transcriptional regulator